MGVDFYACNYCGDTFADCGYFVSCECGEKWCSDECAEAEGFRVEENGFKPKGQKWEQETSCDFCREENFDDSNLLNTALELLNKSRNELIEVHRQKNNS